MSKNVELYMTCLLILLTVHNKVTFVYECNICFFAIYVLLHLLHLAMLLKKMYTIKNMVVHSAFPWW